MKKLVGTIDIYGGGGSGADAPPQVLVCDFNSQTSSPGLDFGDEADEGDWDFN